MLSIEKIEEKPSFKIVLDHDAAIALAGVLSAYEPDHGTPAYAIWDYITDNIRDDVDNKAYRAATYEAREHLKETFGA